MIDQIKDMLKMAESLKATAEQGMAAALANCEKIDDPEMREYLKNSLSLAKSGQLNIAEYLKKVSNDDRITGK